MAGVVHQENLCNYLGRSSELWAERPAIVDPVGRVMTYGELRELSRRIAGYLSECGVGPGDRVGVITPKRAECVAALFGIMAAGGAYVPADFSAPATRNVSIMSDCDVKVVFLDSQCADLLDGWPAPDPPLAIWFPDGSPRPSRPRCVEWSEVAAHEPLDDDVVAGPADLAYILYTSGSTGKPKGVAITHENATSFVDWCSAEFSPTVKDRFSSHAPFHFDLSILDLYLSLKHGATLYLISEVVGKSPQELAGFIESNRLTVWYSTPSILSLLSQFGNLVRRDCSSLRMVLFAGEVFPVKHLRRIVESWPQAAFYNLYGPTETNVCTFARIPAHIPRERELPYPIGHLCPHCDGLVLDGPGGAEVAAGDEGLLHIAGRSLFQGYWNRDVPGIFFERNGRRYYNTGDVVRDAGHDGYIYLGRRDRMVKRRGYRIELGEIERGLYQYEKVRQAAAIAIPDPTSNVRIVAFVAPQPGETASIIELKMHCGKALPAYMSPDVFIVLDELPRTSTDKVDYQRLVSLNATARLT